MTGELKMTTADNDNDDQDNSKRLGDYKRSDILAFLTKMNSNIFVVHLLPSLLLLILTVATTGSFATSECSQSVVTVPEGYELASWHHFRIRRAVLQIFELTSMPCDGFLHSWRFLSMAPEIKQLHLAVFRKTPKTFQIVNETIISHLSLDDAGPDNSSLSRTWITINIPPMQVQRGDVLGIFYDDFNITRDEMVIATESVRTTNMSVAERKIYRTFIFKKDAQTLVRDEKTGDYLQLAMKEAIVSHQKPAIFALISHSKDDDGKRSQWPDTAVEARPSYNKKRARVRARSGNNTQRTSSSAAKQNPLIVSERNGTNLVSIAFSIFFLNFICHQI